MFDRLATSLNQEQGVESFISDVDEHDDEQYEVLHYFGRDNRQAEAIYGSGVCKMMKPFICAGEINSYVSKNDQ